jgi:hypothetical protein
LIPADCRAIADGLPSASCKSETATGYVDGNDVNGTAVVSGYCQNITQIKINFPRMSVRNVEAE